MSVFKCKMCGGTLEINNNETVGVCEYCGTKQTLPKLDDDKIINLYDRANHFRRNNDYDKAMSIYENILNEDKTDAEAYWSLVLCRYGIEYVEDPATHKRVPTVNRAQFTSVFMDEDYKSAIEYADPVQKSIYEAEAKAIDEIQKGILEISQKEEPFDVFICYKETDVNGRRTQDSVLANDLYHQLTQEGFKVFFSRITLEDKLGTAYEPYIFAALNSAKVMVVIGTKTEYFNAVWVKNEWSRYLALIKQGQKKILIPAYRDIDPYDLPEEFSHLQAQDMSKLGFMQDLIRGIKKLAQEEAPKTTVIKETVITSENVNTVPLLKRAFMFLEDGDWKSANEYCEKVLDIDPENAEAYLGKLMVEYKVRNKENLGNSNRIIDRSKNYNSIMRFGSPELIEQLKKYSDESYENEYNFAVGFMNSNQLDKAVSLFSEIVSYKNSAELINKCKVGIQNNAYDKLYYNATQLMKTDGIEYYEKAIELFKTIINWKDSKTQIINCRERINVLKNDRTYRYAIELMKEDKIGSYEKAIEQFKLISNWKDSEAQIENCRIRINAIKKDNIYGFALELMNKNRVEYYAEAIDVFNAINDWRDSSTQIDICEGKINAYINKIKRNRQIRTIIFLPLTIIFALLIIGFSVSIFSNMDPNAINDIEFRIKLLALFVLFVGFAVFLVMSILACKQLSYYKKGGYQRYLNERIKRVHASNFEKIEQRHRGIVNNPRRKR